jgi:hypothetical protein
VRSFKNLSPSFIRGLGQGMPILCYGLPAVASGQGDMVGCGDGEVVLNHAKVVGADGRGDIPPGWSVSVLWGLGSTGPGYMLK